MKKKKINHMHQTKMIADVINGEPLDAYRGKEYEPDIRGPKQSTGRKNKMVEKGVEKQIIWAINDRTDCVCIKSGETSVYNKKYTLHGMSDLMVFVPGGGVIFMEVKGPKGRQRPTQVKFEELCKECGLSYYIVRSVEDAMKSIKKCR